MPVPSSKSAVIDQLKKDLLVLQGFKSAGRDTIIDTGLGPILQSFPQARFPFGAVHEFISTNEEDTCATTGFIAGLLSSVVSNGTALLWINGSANVFPPALKQFGVDAQHIIFIHLQKQKDMLWVMEEALKCDALSAVVAEISELNFTESRRLQLAVEQSRVTGFIIRNVPKRLQVTACIARWRITQLPGLSVEELPGVGFAQWKVELQKIRNGKPGTWEITWMDGHFKHKYKTAAIVTQMQQTA